MAAAFTAAALIQIFPKVTLLGSRCERYGFAVEATVPGGLNRDGLKLIEERVRVLKKGPARVMEMMGLNAAELLRAHHQVVRAKQAKAFERELVYVVEIGSFADLCEMEKITPFDGYQLLDLEQKGDHIVLRGVAHETHQETKNFVRQLKTLRLRDHRCQVKFIDGEACWTPELEKIRFGLILQWRAWIEKNGGGVFDGPEVPKGFAGRVSIGDSGEGRAGLFDADTSSCGEVFSASNKSVELFFQHIGLDVFSRGSDWFIQDIYGVEWCVAREGLCPVSFERCVALLLEAKK